jgi:hypothetical protein
MQEKETSYGERAGRMARKARTTAVKAGAKLFIKARHTMASAQIDTVNLLRAAGEKFNQAAGKNQLLFNLEGLEFCRKEFLPLLKPCGMGIKEIQACVHIASRVRKPIKTAEELGAVKQELQMSLRVLGLIEQPHHEGQSLIERNLFCTLTTATRKFELLLDDMEREKPMAQWGREALDEFLETAAPVEAVFVKARKLLSCLPPPPLEIK